MHILLTARQSSLKSLKTNVSNLRETYTNSANNSVKLEDVRRLRIDFLDQYPNDEDNTKLIDRYIPYIIAPTENEWQEPPQ